ncbi:DNA (cytosine-5)-methyltransferase 3B [Balamuthia mandrillaris]
MASKRTSTSHPFSHASHPTSATNDEICEKDEAEDDEEDGDEEGNERKVMLKSEATTLTECNLRALFADSTRWQLLHDQLLHPKNSRRYRFFSGPWLSMVASSCLLLSSSASSFLENYTECPMQVGSSEKVRRQWHARRLLHLNLARLYAFLLRKRRRQQQQQRARVPSSYCEEAREGEGRQGEGGEARGGEETEWQRFVGDMPVMILCVSHVNERGQKVVVLRDPSRERDAWGCVVEPDCLLLRLHALPGTVLLLSNPKAKLDPTGRTVLLQLDSATFQTSNSHHNRHQQPIQKRVWQSDEPIPWRWRDRDRKLWFPRPPQFTLQDGFYTPLSIYTPPDRQEEAEDEYITKAKARHDRPLMELLQTDSFLLKQWKEMHAPKLKPKPKSWLLSLQRQKQQQEPERSRKVPFTTPIATKRKEVEQESLMEEYHSQEVMQGVEILCESQGDEEEEEGFNDSQSSQQSSSSASSIESYPLRRQESDPGYFAAIIPFSSSDSDEEREDEEEAEHNNEDREDKDEEVNLAEEDSEEKVEEEAEEEEVEKEEEEEEEEEEEPQTLKRGEDIVLKTEKIRKAGTQEEAIVPKKPSLNFDYHPLSQQQQSSVSLYSTTAMTTPKQRKTRSQRKVFSQPSSSSTSSSQSSSSFHNISNFFTRVRREEDKQDPLAFLFQSFERDKEKRQLRSSQDENEKDKETEKETKRKRKRIRKPQVVSSPKPSLCSSSPQPRHKRRRSQDTLTCSSANILRFNENISSSQWTQNTPRPVKRGLRVLSLFDGISGAYHALRLSGVPIAQYLVSEIDPHCLRLTKQRLGSICEFLGDARLLNGAELIAKYGQIHLLFAGFPCQDLSFLNRNRQGLRGDRSKLFYEVPRLLEELEAVQGFCPYFIVENVASMSPKDKALITDALGVVPIFLDAQRFSATSRKRFYWVNIPQFRFQPKHIKLQDMLDPGGTAITMKAACITTGNHLAFVKYTNEYYSDPRVQQSLRRYNLVKDATEENGFRGLRTTEVERLLGFPKNWTNLNGVSRQQRNKMLGNSFSVPVIAGLLRPLAWRMEGPEHNVLSKIKRRVVAQQTLTQVFPRAAAPPLSPSDERQLLLEAAEEEEARARQQEAYERPSGEWKNEPEMEWKTDSPIDVFWVRPSEDTNDDCEDDCKWERMYE